MGIGSSKALRVAVRTAFLLSILSVPLSAAMGATPCKTRRLRANLALQHPRVGERMSRFIDCFGAQSNYLESEARLRARDMRTIEIESVDLVGRELKSDTEEGKMISRLLKQASKKTKSAPWVIPMLAQYLQVRYLYEQGGIWSAHIGSSPDFGIKV